MGKNKYKKSEWSVKRPLYLSKTDPRYKRYNHQLDKRGFSDTETWCLGKNICKFALPRLIRFKKINTCYPAGLTLEKWNEMLDDMIFAFKSVVDEVPTDEDRYRRGMRYFTERILDLWW